MSAFMYFRGNFDPPGAAHAARLFLAGEYGKFSEYISGSMAFRGPLRKEILQEVHGPGSAEQKTIGEGTLAKATMDIFGRSKGKGKNGD